MAGAGIVILALVAAAAVAVGKKKTGDVPAPVPPSKRPMSEEEAVEAAIQRGGSRDTMTNMVYWASHPDCPQKLDGDDPSHEWCLKIWLRLRDKINARLRKPPKKPPKAPPPPTSRDECDPLDPGTWGSGTCVFKEGRWRREPFAEPAGTPVSTLPDVAGARGFPNSNLVMSHVMVEVLDHVYSLFKTGTTAADKAQWTYEEVSFVKCGSKECGQVSKFCLRMAIVANYASHIGDGAMRDAALADMRSRNC